jgi:hypothetical protein
MQLFVRRGSLKTEDDRSGGGEMEPTASPRKNPDKGVSGHIRARTRCGDPALM